jgi:thiol-disulfide isomerase/thioredoxin
MKPTIAMLHLALVLVACQRNESSIVVSLQPDLVDTASDQPLWGLTNIFFAEPNEETLSARLRIADHWDDVEIAEVLALEGMDPVYAARYADTAGEIRYVVDTDGDLDLRDEHPLALRLINEKAMAATVDLEVPPSTEADAPAWLVPYQIVIDAEEGYTYARIVEYRRGTIQVAGERYNVMLRPRSRNHPVYALDSGTLMFIDRNQDSTFDQRPGLTQGETMVANEQVNVLQPFLIGDRGFRVTHVDSAGTSLTLEPTTVAQAPVVGFEAPDLVARTLAGRPMSLGELDGKVVVIEFWSTSCSFSERARPTLNEIAAAYDQEELTWLAISKESDVQEVNEFLREHHRAAHIVMADSATWREYNPTVVTPTYYVIDPSGTIRLREQGASAAHTVAKVVDDLVPAP